MNLFNRLFRKPTEKSQLPILLGMVLLPNETLFSLESVINDHQQHYSVRIVPEGDDIASSFTIDGEEIGILSIDKPVPADDIQRTAQYTYNWKTALEDLKDHHAHIIIAITNGSFNMIKRFKLQTQLLCSVLRTTNAIGVYIGEQSLLIPKDKYLRDAENMSDTILPINLWVYFGLRVVDGLSNAYTYGLKAFAKDEIEVLDSNEDLYNLLEMLINITQYVLLNDVTFKPGQTLGYTAQQQIMISYSEGSYVEGNSFKLLF